MARKSGIKIKKENEDLLSSKRNKGFEYYFANTSDSKGEYAVFKFIESMCSSENERDEALFEVSKILSLESAEKVLKMLKKLQKEMEAHPVWAVLRLLKSNIKGHKNQDYDTIVQNTKGLIQLFLEVPSWNLRRILEAVEKIAFESDSEVIKKLEKICEMEGWGAHRLICNLHLETERPIESKCDDILVNIFKGQNQIDINRSRS